jgi:K+-transporting ATPase ATPase A chain
MATNDYVEIVVFLLLLVGLTPLLGTFMAKVLGGERNLLTPILGPLERFVYRIMGVDNTQSMSWKRYALSLLMFNFAGTLLLFLLLLAQQWLPLNPQQLPSLNWHTALNASISFVTNTNWQSYAGETQLSYFSQMVGLTVQNFLSAATGIAVMVALVRGIMGRTTDQIGNFWVDVTRAVLYVLVPLSVLLAIVLVGQGVVQNFDQYTHVSTLQGGAQVIPQGPAASQIAIKQLGTNGGGFFNANSAHPFENPTPFSNFLQVLAILLIPASLTYTYGRMVKSQAQGWAIFAAMFLLFAAGLAISFWSESQSSGLWNGMTFMEGKEARIGVGNSVLWSTATTAASNGSVNSMLDSMTPLAGMVGMVNILLGEVVFGGVGAGLYGMVIFIILTVFIAGLMVGRTPEYLGKKMEAFEVKMAMVAVLGPSAVILLFSAIACSIPAGLSGLNNNGPHGLTEILYAFTSAAGNNGSAFAGLTASSVFYNLLTGVGMLIGRYGIIFPVLAIAGSLARKKTIPVSQGTFRTDNALFVGLLVAVILIVGGLTFFPALSLGPIVEHLMLQNGSLF